jgi:oligopeptide/dipeptide ABC transporter ATP-binding protein
MSDDPLIRLEGVTLDLLMDGRPAPVLRDVSFEIARGEVLGLVGESGSGKSMSARTIMRLLPSGARPSGSVNFEGRDVLSLSHEQLRQLRLRKIAMIFQDPRAFINPVYRIGDFLTEPLTAERGISKADANKQAVEVLASVGIPDGQRRLSQYPHELSGGLLQRVMIAAAVLCEPELLLADEPTTALDVTTQVEVMKVLIGKVRELGMAMLFITHDIELAVAVCDRIAVMYAGEIVEARPSEELVDGPRHPYTSGLIGSQPRIDVRMERMPQINGRPLSAFEAPGGCAFQGRCHYVQDRCRTELQSLRELDGGLVRCCRAEEIGAQLLAATDGGAS